MTAGEAKRTIWTDSGRENLALHISGAPQLCTVPKEATIQVINAGTTLGQEKGSDPEVIFPLGGREAVEQSRMPSAQRKTQDASVESEGSLH